MPQIPILIPSCDLDTDVDVNISSPVVPKWKMLKIRHKKKKTKKHFGSLFLAWVLLFFGGLVFAWYEFGLGRGRGCGCGLLGCCWAYRSTWPSTWIALECCKYFLRLPARRLETETNLECPPEGRWAPKNWVEMSLAYYEVSGGLLKFSLPPVSRSLHIDIYWQCCLGESQNISGLAWDSTKNSRYLKLI